MDDCVAKDIAKCWEGRYEHLSKLPLPAWKKAGWWYPYIEQRQRRFAREGLRAIGFNGVLRIADIGCGPGQESRDAALMGHDTYAIDRSLGMLRCQKKSSAELTIRLVNGDAGLLPISACSFDAVICFGVLQTSEKPAGIIAEMARILKPGGHLLLTTLRKTSIWELPFWPWHVLMSIGHFPEGGGRYSWSVSDRVYMRDGSSGRNMHGLRRYKNGELKKWLVASGLSGMSFSYDPPIRYVPWLHNSFMVYIKARKRPE